MKAFDFHPTDLINLKAKITDKILDILLVVLSIIVVYNGFQIQTKIINSLRTDIANQIEKNEALDKVVGLEKAMDSYQQLFTQKDRSESINTINNIAKESGVSITSISPEAKMSFLGYTQQPFVLSVSSANYHLIGKFISRIENHPHIYLVDAINITKVAGGTAKVVLYPGREKLRASISLSTFYIIR